MKTKINNLDELKWEIARLTEKKREQESYLQNQYSLLKDKVSMPMRVIDTVSSSIPGFSLLKGMFSFASSTKSEDIKDSNWLTNAVRIGMPLLLNKTFLKNTGWLKKSLILLLSDTAAKQVTQDNISSWITTLTSYIRPKNRKRKNKTEPESYNNPMDRVVDDPIDDQILGI